MLIAVKRIHDQWFALTQLFLDSRQIVFRHIENHGDRLKLRDDQQGIRVARVNDIARVHQAQADAAGNRRGDVAVGELHLGAFHRGRIRLHGGFQFLDLGGDLVIGVLRINFGGDQVGFAFQFDLLKI